MRRWKIPAIALFFLVIGILLGRFGWGDAVVERAGALGQRAVGLALGTVARTFSSDVRLQILAENPDLLAAISRGGSFGGTYTVAVARGNRRRSSPRKIFRRALIATCACEGPLRTT